MFPLRYHNVYHFCFKHFDILRNSLYADLQCVYFMNYELQHATCWTCASYPTKFIILFVTAVLVLRRQLQQVDKHCWWRVGMHRSRLYEERQAAQQVLVKWSSHVNRLRCVNSRCRLQPCSQQSSSYRNSSKNSSESFFWHHAMSASWHATLKQTCPRTRGYRYTH